MLPQERSGVLAALSEALVAVAEVRAGLLDELPLDGDIEDASLPRDAIAVDDVELGLLEGWRHLVLHDFDANAVADRLHALLQRLDAADVEADRGVELQRPPARSRLGVSEHDPDLLAQLIREDRDGAGAVERPRELAERLAHEPCL